MLSGAFRFFSGLFLGAMLACGGSSSPTKADPTPPAVAPTITAQPQAKTVVAGEAATFTVTATGTAPLHYAWTKDGATVGTDAASCAIASTQPAHAGIYAVTVTNAAGSVPSQAAPLTVQHITLTSQPQPQHVNEGNQATFQVTATGVPAALSYQWQRLANGTWHDIPGAHESSYVTPTALALDGGASFRCHVSNAALAKDSDPAILQVNWLRLGAQPLPQSVVAGQPASFSVDAAGYPASLAYQWQRNSGAGWTDLPGATLATYTFIPVASDTGAQFRCRVSNGVLGLDSLVAALVTGLGLTVTITGLPAGVDANVTVSGPNGFNQVLNTTQTLIVPAAGTYTLAATTVEDPSLPPLGDVLSPTTHLARHPWQPRQTIAVSSSGTASIDVLYPLPAFTVNLPDAANPGSTVPMDFVLAPAGSFRMGESRPSTNPHYVSDATPTRLVTFAKAFYLAKYPCTQEQWRAVMNANPSRFSSVNGYADPCELKRPVDSVNWDDLRTPSTGFLDVLNAQLPGYGFRLPSEAEYEYALRGGTTSDYFFGAYPSSSMGSSFYLYRAGDEFSWATAFVLGYPNHPVGTKRPNPWGLYDLMGSIFEWCEDDYHPNYTGAPVDGSAWVDSPTRGNHRVLRGSGNRLEDMASCVRADETPSERLWQAFGWEGFRLAVGVPVSSNPAGPSISVSMPGLLTTDPTASQDVTVLGDVKITGPNGFSQNLTAGATLTGLAEGTYTLTAIRVQDASQPGLGLANGGPLGTLHLARYPSLSTTTVTLGAATGTLHLPVVYPVPTFQHRCNGWLDIPLVLIPPGSFTMGSQDTEPDRNGIEGPQRTVTFQNLFYMSSTEVTQRLWSGLMGTPIPPVQDEAKPVGQVSWNDIPEFLKRLNTATEGQRMPGMAFRLPTEAEWEYACRAGSTSAFYWGSYSADAFAWYSMNAGSTSHPVATKAPNAWGLYDMSGNGWEWCQDWFGTYASDPEVDPTGPAFGTGRVLRGGGFAYGLPYLRSALRAFADPTSQYGHVGFRVALVSGAPVITTGPVNQTIAMGDSVTFTVVAKGLGPLHYQWKLNGGSFNLDTPTLTLTSVDLSYDGNYTVTVSNALGSATSSVARLTVNPPPIRESPKVTSAPVPQSVTEGDSATFTVVATGTAPLHYQWQKNGANVGTDSSQFTILSTQLSDAGQYRVIVTNEVGSWTTGAVPLVVNPAVVITTQPASQMVAVGDDFTLTTAATGAAPLHYQWTKDGANVGSDLDHLTVTGAQVADSGSYTVTVSNTKGNAISNAAVVTVTTDPVAPLITTHPVSQSVSAGFGVTFTVVATGTKPLHYQWKKGITPVGSDANQFVIASAQAADAGSYTVTVTNSGGNAISNAADLTVATTPSFTLPGNVPLTLASIPSGTFTMGSSTTEHGTSYPMEGPQHQVTISSFYMGAYEVTQAQWKAVMGNNPSYFSVAGGHAAVDDLTRPVEQV
ncbi:MAG: SUMF1/EgtB/PvdO family nonheme iron enzyme, partial [Holophaga sp.]